ncbi:SDR family NAD(P)-dependent oxidoreductase [Desulfovibrio psychrotolerans]|uniref:Oxidoreductase n=1 Tax=Desulfovibrio psychrotolerans TaxID=415242 RepID=A0A7J0BWN0_9BACT|nr:SDR family oxidoreductase [Desulfovibrio psychrotolerans]GFM38129.1 oxidoreductase [Desulfovibrio psychrotolerans]
MASSIALVTGASGGIGTAIVNALLARGIHVIAQHNNTPLSESIAEHPGLTALRCDFADQQGSLALLDAVLAEHGGLDILICNAASYHGYASLDDIAVQDLETSFAINTFMPFLLAQRALRYMEPQQRGRILFLSSIGVKFGGSIASLPYASSKAALETMTITLAKRYAELGIPCNAVRVGVTDTGIHARNPSKDMGKRVSLIPAKRMARPEEIANVVCYLTLDAPTFLTGAVIPVSGGE